MNHKPQPEQPPPEQQVRDAAETGMFAMMAMMVVCCVGIFVLVLLIPLIGWPAGAIVAISLGAALMYAHMKMMNHGTHH